MKKKSLHIKKKIIKSKDLFPKFNESLTRCELCAHKCKADRYNGETGYCGCGRDPIVYTYGPHHGEEPPLSGYSGSGTIFFSLCNLGCVYCQNHKFSKKKNGKIISARELADIMLQLQKEKCHNINLVSPTPFVPSIVEALSYACSDGLILPIVYNTGGYDSLDTIRSLDGIVDIYLPDMRYSSDEMAEMYSHSPGYVENNRAIVMEMLRQTGELVLSGDGIADRGLIIRLLMLPSRVSGTENTLEFISKRLGKNQYLSVMSQYYPAYKARAYKKLSKRLEREYYDEITDKMKSLGFSNGWIQPFEEGFDPDFAGENF